MDIRKNRLNSRMWRNVRKNVWFLSTLIIAVIAITLGIFGYLQYPQYNQLESMYGAIRLFTINVEVPVEENLNLSLEFARWLTLVVLVSGALGTVWYFFKNELSLLLLPFNKNHYIIVGLTEGAYSLANEMRVNHDQVVIIEKNPKNPFIEELRKKGCIIILKDISDLHFTNHLALHNAAGLIIYSMNDNENVEILFKAIEEYEWKRNFEKKMESYIHLNEKYFVKLIDAKIANKNINVSIFNQYELGAKYLFDQKPIYTNLDIVNESAKQGHILILGFGLEGKHVAIEAIRRSHFPNLKKLKMTIIDEQAVQKGDEFLGEFPCIHQSVEIKFISSKPLSNEFRNRLKEFAPEVTYVVLAFENDELDYKISTLLIEEFDQLPVALRLKNSNHLLHTHNIDQHQFKETFHYTDSKDISNKKYIIQDEMSQVAKMIHDIYSTENKSTPLDLWKNLSRMKQDSNMAQADHIDTKLYALGVKRIRKENRNLPWLNLAFDGQEDTDNEARLQAFMYQVKQNFSVKSSEESEQTLKTIETKL